MRNVVSLVLGGGRGSRLFPLTSVRSKPAVPLAGKYRLIDVPISNCINSGIKKIYVLTQFLSVSLHAHIRRTYSFDQFSGGFVELLAARETMGDLCWYQGTADAVRKNLLYIEQGGIDYVLILSGDQLYRMDFRQLIDQHRQSGADVTIACRPVTAEAARSFGIMRVDASGRVVGFLEKPQTDAELDLVRMPTPWHGDNGGSGQRREFLASLGIYVFNRGTLVDALTKTSYADFGREVFPAAIRTRHVQTFLFDDYWEDIGTIRSFYDANLSLTRPHPPFRFAIPDAPIYSRPRFLPATRIEGATIAHSLIADGCHIGAGATIENSVLGLRTVVGPNVTIRNSVIMGADWYEGEATAETHSHVPVGIGHGSLIDGAIIDKNCRIGPAVRIVNDAGVMESSHTHPLCVTRDGIPVVIKNSELVEGWSLDEVFPSATSGGSVPPPKSAKGGAPVRSTSDR
jgi:glucose-1-phosphate adenylyltransferase